MIQVPEKEPLKPYIVSFNNTSVCLLKLHTFPFEQCFKCPYLWMVFGQMITTSISLNLIFRYYKSSASWCHSLCCSVDYPNTGSNEWSLKASQINGCSMFCYLDQFDASGGRHPNFDIIISMYWNDRERVHPFPAPTCRGGHPPVPSLKPTNAICFVFCSPQQKQCSCRQDWVKNEMKRDTSWSNYLVKQNWTTLLYLFPLKLSWGNISR